MNLQEQEQIQLLKQLVEQNEKKAHRNKVLIYWGLWLVALFVPMGKILIIPLLVYGIYKLIEKGAKGAIEVGKRDKVWIDALDKKLENSKFDEWWNK